MKKSIIILFFLVSSFSCKNTKDTHSHIQFRQLTNTLPVTIRVDTMNNEIVRIYLRIPFELISSSTKTEYVNHIDYYYGKDQGDGWFGSFLIYRPNNTIATNARRLKEKGINSTHPQQFYIYTGHDVDTVDKCLLHQLKPYIDSIRASHTDTLSIESFGIFQEKYPMLVKTLLQKDSVRVGIFTNPNEPYDETKDIFITLPIKY